MKNTLFICLFAMFALSGCVDDEEEFATGGNISPELTPENKENAVLNTAVFDQLNLDYPGLEKVKQYHLEDCVQFLGMRNDVPQLMQAMDCFVLPSKFEGLPVVGIEAQAAGLPCFFADTITREVGITELVYFFPIQNNEKQWAEIIVGTCKNGKRKNMEKEISNAGYDIQSEIRKIENFYIMQGHCKI